MQTRFYSERKEKEALEDESGAENDYASEYESEDESDEYDSNEYLSDESAEYVSDDYLTDESEEINHLDFLVLNESIESKDSSKPDFSRRSRRKIRF